MQIPGIGVFGALAILGEFGEITRFAKTKERCGYVGLVPSLHRSGQKNTGGQNPKVGRP